MPIPVVLQHCPEYADPQLERMIDDMLYASGFFPATGMRVLVKPNMVGARNAEISNTHPLFVRQVCRVLLKYGAKVTVGDSPSFGTALSVAQRSGLAKALQDLPVRLISLGRPRTIRLPGGVSIGISRDALEADAIVNLPKLKVHNQMRISAAVKNLFGCVCGPRKALAHYRHGDEGNRFPRMILDIAELVPAQLHIVDGIRAMHIKGPIWGESHPLNLVAASTNMHALDATLYNALGLVPTDVPLWHLALSMGRPGADLGGVYFPEKTPQDVDVSGFVIPAELNPETFAPQRLLKGRLKSLWQRFF